ncbi:MAG: phosphoenolpyruvate--protein phosphotransferase [Spirochaetia bacterium]|nr:phosphoenolpyruvate--protein phosphotransferase [Spirochaetia bacterium]
MSYIPLQQEDNPYLGLRGIRLLFSFEQILRTQLQAILLASESGPVGVMIPMVSSLETVRRVRSILNEEIALLGWASAPNLSLGIMVETPSAVVMIEELLQEVDFVSIGTNDLTQYTLAADRGNPDVDCYYDEFHPAVIRSIAKVISSSKEKQIRNGVCGELAGNVLALPFFMGLGVDELSANPVVLAELKYAMRQIDSRDAQVLVDEILKLTSSKDIRARLHAFLHERGLLR